MSDITTLQAVLPHQLPHCGNARLTLFAMRRMGAHGIDDARAAHMMMSAFGQNFRRPLILMQALMTDLASQTAATLSIAPCCCTRMTASEAALLTILHRVETTPESARILMADLLSTRRVDSVLASAAAVAMAFADEGRPIG